MAVLLSLVMVVGLFAGVPMKAEAATLSVTADEAISWVQSKVGQSVGNTYNGAYQCVGLTYQYMKAIGISNPFGGSAYEYASTSAVPSGIERIQGATPQKGDILIWLGGYGHVAVYENDYSTYHQNYNYKQTVSHETWKYNNTAYLSSGQYYWGVWRPKFSSGSSYNDPVGAVDTVSSHNDQVHVSGWAFDWDVPTTAIGIHVYMGGPAGSGTCVATTTANRERCDVAAAYNGVGNYHGYDVTFSTSLRGNQRVYVYAINAGGGNNNPCIGDGTVNITGDTTKPTVSNMKIYDVTNKGYWVSCTVSDNVGVTSVKFPTWISGWPESRIKWLNGTLNGNTATCYIKASDFTTSSANFVTDAYAYDAAGNTSNYQRKTVYIDRDKPTVSNMKIYDVTNKGYWVSCTVSDNVKVTRVKFPTWLNDYSEEQIHWLDGTLNGNTATCYVNISEFTDKTYRIVTDIRAYDAAGNMSDVVRQGVTIDQEAPTVSDLHVEAEDEEGYTVSCKVTDDHAGVSKVRFLTQTEDIGSVDASAGESGTQNGDTYTFRVSYDKHDYVIGTYTTHIYVCDAWGNSKVEKIKREVRGDVEEGDLPQGEEVPNGLWIVGTANESYTYTGKAVKPEVRVYDSSRLLTAGRDYSISYKNNINANDGMTEKTAPTITVKGKGNYNGRDEVTFVIEQKNLSDSDVTAENIVRKTNGKEQKIVPVLSYNGKKLKNKKDFTISYPNAEEGAYKEPGEYTIVITGIGNYTGSREIRLSLTGAKLVSKLSVGKIAVQTYTGEALKPQITVKDGKKELKEGEDYTVSYAKNREVGTAEALITGIGQYAGTKKVTFRIAANASIGSAQILLTTADGWSYKEDVYSGKEKKPAAYEVTVVVRGEKNQTKTVTLQEGRDYTVSYQNNVGAGIATVTFTGINGCSGSQKKKYKITAYDLGEGENAAERVGIQLENEYAYVKGGCCPKPVVTFDGTILKEGRDYTLTYRNNTGVNDGSTENRQPTVTVRRHIVGGINSTLFSVVLPPRLCSSVGNSRLSPRQPHAVVALFERQDSCF